MHLTSVSNYPNVVGRKLQHYLRERFPVTIRSADGIGYDSKSYQFHDERKSCSSARRESRDFTKI